MTALPLHGIVGTVRRQDEYGMWVVIDECACGDMVKSTGATEARAMLEAAKAWPRHTQA